MPRGCVIVADAALVKDPHAQLYRISNDAARKVSQSLGPEAALVELARRARVAELRVEEADALAAAGHERHVRLQLIVSGERAAEVARLSLGQRLDQALTGLGVLSEVSAARLDADVVSGSRGGGGVPFRVRREVESIERDVLALVERAERELARSRRRLVETEAA
jgi:hypothetical protein